MGVSSGTLQGIESLDATLSEIERKLNIIENAHVKIGSDQNDDLLSPSISSQDNKVVIFGQSIWCREAVKLVVGPILGVITSHSVRILMEVSATTVVTFFVFVGNTNSAQQEFSSELSRTLRFVKKVNLSVDELNPTAITISGLSSNSFYVIYAGGICASDTVSKFASFYTSDGTHYASDVPEGKGDIAIMPRMIFSQNGRLDNLLPNEVNLVQSVAHRVAARASDRPVQLFVHCGNLLSVDDVIEVQAMAVLDSLLRDDCESQAWQQGLAQMEQSVRQLYRRVLSDPDLSAIMRSCSCLFVCGEGEAASRTARLFLAESMAEVRQDESSSVSADQPKRSQVGGKVVRMGAKDGDSVSVSLTSQLLLGDSVRARRQEARKRSRERVAIQDELRMLLLGAILRLMRRISWSYFRNLWDEDFPKVLEEEITRDTHYREILRLRKTMYVKRSLQAAVEVAEAKAVREFGSDSKAAENLLSSNAALAEEMRRLEEALRKVAVASSDFNVSSPARPAGAVWSSGCSCIVVVESAWSGLAADGQAMALETAQTEQDIHEQIFDNLEERLNPQLFESEPGGGPPPAKLLSVVVVTAAPLLPFACHSDGESGGDRGGDAPSPHLLLNWSYRVAKDGGGSSERSAGISEMDGRRLLKLLARWQQESQDRAVLLVANSDAGFCIRGEAFPTTVDDRGQELVSEEQLDRPENVVFNIWNSARSRLQLLLLGSLAQRGRTLLPNLAQSFSSSALIGSPKHLAQYSGLHFKAEFDLESVSARRSFWDARFLPLALPKHAPDGSIEVEVPASYALEACTDISRPERSQLQRVLLGPLVFKVTSTSAVVMVELALSGPVELLCVDQLTGEEFICAQLAVAKRPCFFHFELLHSNHAYDVMVAEPLQFDHETNFFPSAVASFTTHRRLSAEQEDDVDFEDEEGSQILKLRAIAAAEPSTAADLRSYASFEAKSLVSSAISLEKSAQSSSLKADSQIGGRPKKRRVPFRILATGSLRPPTAIASAAGSREQLLAGLELCRSIVFAAGQSWAGADLVAHCGDAVDFSPVIAEVLSLLSRAEAEDAANGGHSGGRSALLLSQAEERLRDAFRFHWNSNPVSQLLRHGAHLVFSSSSLTLLNCFGAASVRQLERELSPFCGRQLDRMFALLDFEYLPRDSHIHSFENESVVLFHLLPSVKIGEGAWGRRTGLLTDEQLSSLHKLLRPTALGSSSRAAGDSADDSAIGRGADRQLTLVLMSPIPLILDDEFVDQCSAISPESAGIRYSQGEVRELLDLAAQWLEESPEMREVVVLTGSACGSFTSSIEIASPATITPPPPPDGPGSIASSLKHSSAPASSPRMTQVCCGPVLGSADAALNVPLHSIKIHSPTREFKVQHRPYSSPGAPGLGAGNGAAAPDGPLFAAEPLCTVIDVPVSASRSIGEKKRAATRRSRIRQLDRSAFVTLLPFLESERAPLLARPRLGSEFPAAAQVIGRVQAVGLSPHGTASSSTFTSDAEIFHNIESAVTYVMDKASALLERCHGMFVAQSCFPLPVSGDMSVEACFHAITQWILSQLNEPSRQICKLPSSLAVRMVWESRRSALFAQRTVALVDGDGSDIGMDFNREITAQMQADGDYFKKLLTDFFQVQLMLEYVSFSSGLLDDGALS